MEEDRTRRYETAKALAMDVRRYLDIEPVLDRREPRQQIVSQGVSKEPAGFLGFGGAVTASRTVVQSVPDSLSTR